MIDQVAQGDLMDTSRSLDEMISKQAALLADQIKQAAVSASNSKDYPVGHF